MTTAVRTQNRLAVATIALSVVSVVALVVNPSLTMADAIVTLGLGVAFLVLSRGAPRRLIGPEVPEAAGPRCVA